jgi:hypothetical protein
MPLRYQQALRLGNRYPIRNVSVAQRWGHELRLHLFPSREVRPLADCRTARGFALRGLRKARREVPALVVSGGDERAWTAAKLGTAGQAVENLRGSRRPLSRPGDEVPHYRLEPSALRRIPDRRVVARQSFEPDPAQDIVGEHRTP